ncbi:MAG: DUF1491 family protein [Novosphingobium sp.]
MDVRIAPQIEVSALVRQVHAAGGFAAVLRKGHPEAGTILVVVTRNGADSRVYERMPLLDGTRGWHCAKHQNDENKQEFSDYLTRRAHQDDDLWIVELDIVDGERFIGLSSSTT